MLGSSMRPKRQHHDASVRKLLDQRFWDGIGSGRDDDSVKRGARNLIERPQYGSVCNAPLPHAQQKLHPADAVLVSWRGHEDAPSFRRLSPDFRGTSSEPYTRVSSNHSARAGTKARREGLG